MRAARIVQRCPPLALSRHSGLHRTCLLSRSLSGVKRTLVGALPLMTQSGHRAVLHFICALMNEADIHRSALSGLLLRNLRNDDTLAKKIVQRVFQITDSC